MDCYEMQAVLASCLFMPIFSVRLAYFKEQLFKKTPPYSQVGVAGANKEFKYLAKYRINQMRAKECCKSLRFPCGARKHATDSIS